jgi:hypothetical protein
LIILILVVLVIGWVVITGVGSSLGIFAAKFGKPKPGDKIIWRPYQDDEFPEETEEPDEDS